MLDLLARRQKKFRNIFNLLLQIPLSCCYLVAFADAAVISLSSCAHLLPTSSTNETRLLHKSYDETVVIPSRNETPLPLSRPHYDPNGSIGFQHLV